MENDCHYLENGLSYCYDRMFFFFPCALTCKGMYGEKCIKVVMFGPQTAEKDSKEDEGSPDNFWISHYCWTKNKQVWNSWTYLDH